MADLAEIREMVAELRLRESRALRNLPAAARNSFGAGSYTGAVEVLDELDEELAALGKPGGRGQGAEARVGELDDKRRRQVEALLDAVAKEKTRAEQAESQRDALQARLEEAQHFANRVADALGKPGRAGDVGLAREYCHALLTTTTDTGQPKTNLQRMEEAEIPGMESVDDGSGPRAPETVSIPRDTAIRFLQGADDRADRRIMKEALNARADARHLL